MGIFHRSKAALILGAAWTVSSCAGTGVADIQKAIFNGKDLTGWEGRRDVWRVENGEIVGKAAQFSGVEYLVFARPLADFRLTVDVKLAGEKGNSGIHFRSERFQTTDMKGYQADIGPGAWGKLIERNGRGPLSEDAAERSARPGDWNTYEILAVGNRIQLALNGKMSADFTDPRPARSGLIGLQMAGEAVDIEIRFRNIALETDPEPRLKTVR